MIYAASDIHGCYEKYQRLLERLRLSEDDTLYILGDLVDRGDGGMKLIKDLAGRKNVVCLCGNHDRDARLMLKTFAMPGDGYDEDRLQEDYQIWLADGGAVTYEDFLGLNDRDKRLVLGFLGSLSYKKEVEAAGHRYLLAHTVPGKVKMLGDKPCPMFDYLFGKPDYDRRYYEDKTIVTGHTPTAFIDPAYKGRIWKGNGHIAIDCGAVFGYPLGCICLDTLEEIYVG